MSSTYDMYLVLHPLRDNVSEFQVLLRPLEPLSGDYLLGVDGHYDPATDTAYLALRFPQKTLDRLGSLALHLYTGRSGLPMVVPARLSAPERRRFFMEHLSRATVYLQQYPSAEDDTPLIIRCLTALVSHIEAMPQPTAVRSLDVSADLPIFNPRSTPTPRRLDSVG